MMKRETHSRDEFNGSAHLRRQVPIPQRDTITVAPTQRQLLACGVPYISYRAQVSTCHLDHRPGMPTRQAGG